MSAEKKPEFERVYSTTEAKNQLSAILNFVEGPGEAAIIESHGRPRAAIISIEDLAALRKFKEKHRRELAWKELETIRERVSARNADLSEDQAMELADRFVHEVFEEMQDSGKLYRSAKPTE